MMKSILLIALWCVGTWLESSVVVTAFVPSFLPRQQKRTRTSELALSSSSSSSLAYLEDDNFGKIMRGGNINNKMAILVDVCATWCGPCRLIEPFVEHCAEKFATDLDVVKFDIASTNAKNVKLELLLQGVMPKALPSLILFNAHDGTPIATHTGVLKQEQLEAFLENNLAKIKQMVTTASSSTSTSTTAIQEAVRPMISNTPIVDITATATSREMKKAGLIGFTGTMERDDYALRMT
jgi:thioredoxin 1